MSVRKRLSQFVGLAVLICVSGLALADDLAWTTTFSGGSTIEVPQFFLDGPIRGLMNYGLDGDRSDEEADFGSAYEPLERPISLRQYRTESSERPFVFLSKLAASQTGQITYTVDEDHLGVLSGYTDIEQTTVYYGICRRDGGPVWCVDLFYATEDQSIYGPIVERIAKSFINDESH
jgi:hypothetical protein